MTLSSGKIFGGDKSIWAILIILACVSILAVYSTSIQLNGTNTTHHLVRHCGTLLLGALFIFVFHKLPSKYYRFASCFLYCVGVLALIYTALFAPEINGSRRWIFLLGISVQTSDFAKVFLMMFLAHQLSKYEDSINTVGAFLVKVLLPIFIVCILILPSNLSTALLVYANTLVLLFFSNLKKRYVWGLVGATVVGGFLFFGVILYGNIDIWRFPTWHARIEAWLGGDEQSEGQSDDNFQVYSARMAV
ncbi:MAG: FtsW/RodA/SpoVE family cell cycle protein, partial [Bacteroidales bacterium]|nr:FtsW/RodA/SpoVE family cell cycle protein [Bacteroidales bacterium]